MEPHSRLFFLPLFFLLSSTTAAASFIKQPPSTALLAADALHARGYSIFSSLLNSISSLSTNFSGTLFAPSDFSFSPAAPSFFNNHRPRAPLRPSSSLLLYHTLKPSLPLTWLSLSSRTATDQLPTYYDNYCLFLHRNPHDGEVTISSSALNQPLETVTVRQPDLYVDDHLAIHGIDGVLDPAFAVKCSTAHRINHPTTVAAARPRHVTTRTFIYRAIRSLRGRGYNVVATAMEILRSQLLSLKSITIFAVSDKGLFLHPNGVHYNFRHHVIPMQNRIADLATAGMELHTLAPNRTVRIHTVDGDVHIDGVKVGEEVYCNRRVSVISLNRSLDDYAESPRNRPFATGAVSDNLAFSPISFPGTPPSVDLHPPPPPPPAPAPALAPFDERLKDFAGIDESLGNYVSSLANHTANPPESSNQFAPKKLASSPAPSPARVDDMIANVCDMGAVEGDAYCGAGAARKLREREGDVESSKPLDDKQDLSPKSTMPDIGNIAADLFFYI